MTKWMTGQPTSIMLLPLQLIHYPAIPCQHFDFKEYVNFMQNENLLLELMCLPRYKELLKLKKLDEIGTRSLTNTFLC